ncbi:MAG: tetratricopeptide repeat protein, partial [Gemmatimonadota bacterium]
LGRCFLEKGEFKVAQKVLLRALQIGEDEEKLVAVNYDLGRVHEALGEPGRALEFYERALGVDIGFRDVASRIRALRKKA